MQKLNKWDDFRTNRDQEIDKYVKVKNKIHRANVYLKNTLGYLIIHKIADIFNQEK